MKYPALFTPDTGGYVVTFRDIPEAITQGDDDAEATLMARDVLREAMTIYFDEKRQVPLPSKPQNGERLIALPVIVSAKVLLLNELIGQNVRPAELARRMDIKPQEVNRILDLGHATKIDTVAEALRALGRDLDLIVS